MDDLEDKHDPIRFDDVTYDPVIPDAQPMERVAATAQRLHSFPYPTDASHVACELLECPPQARTNLGLELPEGLRCGRTKLDPIGVQVRSDRLIVRPWA